MRSRRLVRPTDVPPSEDGRKQVENLASRLADEPLDATDANPV